MNTGVFAGRDVFAQSARRKAKSQTPTAKGRHLTAENLKACGFAAVCSFVANDLLFYNGANDS